MAKARKGARATAARQGAEPARFDDRRFGKPLFAATFECNELALTRGAETIGHRMRGALTAASFVALLALVIVTLVDDRAMVLMIAVFAVSLALVIATSRWDRLQRAYARHTTLAALSDSEACHVVVCEDSVHVENEDGPIGDFALSDLRTVHQNADCVVAGFGRRRYVYVPRMAMSENRFRELGRFLKERLPRA